MLRIDIRRHRVLLGGIYVPWRLVQPSWAACRQRCSSMVASTVRPMTRQLMSQVSISRTSPALRNHDTDQAMIAVAVSQSKARCT